MSDIKGFSDVSEIRTIVHDGLAGKTDLINKWLEEGWRIVAINQLMDGDGGNVNANWAGSLIVLAQSSDNDSENYADKIKLLFQYIEDRINQADKALNSDGTVPANPDFWEGTGIAFRAASGKMTLLFPELLKEEEDD